MHARWLNFVFPTFHRFQGILKYFFATNPRTVFDCRTFERPNSNQLRWAALTAQCSMKKNICGFKASCRQKATIHPWLLFVCWTNCLDTYFPQQDAFHFKTITKTHIVLRTRVDDHAYKARPQEMISASDDRMPVNVWYRTEPLQLGNPSQDLAPKIQVIESYATSECPHDYVFVIPRESYVLRREKKEKMASEMKLQTVCQTSHCARL